MRTQRFPTLVICCAIGWIVPSAGAQECSRCAWIPPESANAHFVGNVEELEQTLTRALPHSTIFLRSGKYPLRRMLDLRVPGLVLRGLSGDPSHVTLHGQGSNESAVGVALSISAENVVVADLTIAEVGFHGVQVRGEKRADGVVLHNIRVLDTGQQLVKGSAGSDGHGPDRGLISCSNFSYTAHAPSNYTNGVDILGGTGWLLRHNLFERIRGKPEEGYACGPAILFWKGSRDTIVENNRLRDCYRGIAFGLEKPGPGSRFTHDHIGGKIRMNTLSNVNSWADEGIEVTSGSNVLVEQNTVDVTGHLPWSISIRYPESTATVTDNKTARSITARDGAKLEQSRNIPLEPENQLFALLTRLLKLFGYLCFGALLGALPRRAGLTPLRVLIISFIASGAVLAARLYFDRASPSVLMFLAGAGAIMTGWWLIWSSRLQASPTSNIPIGNRRSGSTSARHDQSSHRSSAWGPLEQLQRVPLLQRIISPVDRWHGPSSTRPRSILGNQGQGQNLRHLEAIRNLVYWLDSAPSSLRLTLLFVASITLMVVTVMTIRSL